MRLEPRVRSWIQKVAHALVQHRQRLRRARHQAVAPRRARRTQSVARLFAASPPASSCLCTLSPQPASLISARCQHAFNALSTYCQHRLSFPRLSSVFVGASSPPPLDRIRRGARSSTTARGGTPLCQAGEFVPLLTLTLQRAQRSEQGLQGKHQRARLLRNSQQD